MPISESSAHRQSRGGRGEGLRQLFFAHAGQNFRERGRRAAGRVLLHAVVHLDDLEVEAGAEDFRGLAREPEERVDAGGIVRGVRSEFWRLQILDLGFLSVGMTGGADNQGFSCAGTKIGECQPSRREN